MGDSAPAHRPPSAPTGAPGRVCCLGVRVAEGWESTGVQTPLKKCWVLARLQNTWVPVHVSVTRHCHLPALSLMTSASQWNCLSSCQLHLNISQQAALLVSFTPSAVSTALGPPSADKPG